MPLRRGFHEKVAFRDRHSRAAEGLGLSPQHVSEGLDQRDFRFSPYPVGGVSGAESGRRAPGLRCGSAGVGRATERGEWNMIE